MRGTQQLPTRSSPFFTLRLRLGASDTTWLAPIDPEAFRA
jgi:hypothetical protein